MAFGNLKQNFGVGEWVRIGAMPPNCELEGMIGRIAGRTTIAAECDFYISFFLPKN